MILAIDQSTSATKAILVDASGRILDKAARPHRQHYPMPGRVEHDAGEIWANVLDATRELAARNDLAALAGVSVTNQRETFVVFDRATGRPLLAVCLSHQILADSLGIQLAPLAAPHQGLQKTVDVFGMPASIGFYNTFTARVPAGTDRVGQADVTADAATGDVYALRGPGYASVQGHLESILSRDGMTTLERLVAHALSLPAASPIE